MKRLACPCILIALSACAPDSMRSEGDAGPMPPPPRDDAGQPPPAPDAAPPADAAPPPVEGCTPSGEGETFVYVLDRLGLGLPDGEPPVSPGFDLDGRVSDESDRLGCFHPDFVGPPPERFEGVDNQIGSLLVAFGYAEGLSRQAADAIRAGQLLVLVELHDVDGFTDDDCVKMHVSYGVLPAGVTAPMLGADGRFVPGQTFDVDATSATPAGEALIRFEDARISAGRLAGGPADVDLRIVAGSDQALRMRDARVLADVSEDRLAAGVLGGAVDVAETAETFGPLAPELPEEALAAVLGAHADLEPDADGSCRSLSMSLVLDGAAAVRGALAD